MAKLTAAAQRKEELRIKLNSRKLKNSCSSRKTNYKKNAIKADMSYADYVKETCGVTITQFEDWTWSLPPRASGGSTPEKGTPEWNEYKSVASRKTYMKDVVMAASCVDPDCDTLDKFVVKYTDAETAKEFLSTEYNKSHKGCYSVRGYEFLEEFH